MSKIAWSYGVLCLGLAGCGPGNGNGDLANVPADMSGPSRADLTTGNPPDLSVGSGDLTMHGDLATSGDLSMGRCVDDKSCGGNTPHCDVTMGQCVACLNAGQCPDGQICKLGACSAGCSGLKGCGDAGVCDVDAGMCKICRADGDCNDPMNSRCDTNSGRCVPCLQMNDNCVKGTICVVSNGAYVCQAGCNKDVDCAPGDGGTGMSTTCCNHLCVDVTADNANCVVCGNACAMGSTCCAQGCTDPKSDIRNCGGCGKVCSSANATGACTAGKCTITKCNDGYADCDNNPDNGCEVNLNADPNNCNACGTVCAVAHATAGCSAMGCTAAKCNDGFADCNNNVKDGCEVDLTSDANNCGMCGSACVAPANANVGCLQKVCIVASCQGSFADCDMKFANGCEVDTSKDVGNCGACAKVCPGVANGSAGCAGGVCGIGACTPPFSDCNMNPGDGCEVDTSKDLNNCGACARKCSPVANGVAACANSACGIGSCNKPYADCNMNPADGCEVNTASDPKNCASCMNVCPNVPNGAPACNNSVCGIGACGGGFKNCSGNPMTGCETNTNVDVNNCGACANKCPGIANGTPGCANSMCGIGACTAPYKDCDNNPQNGCEVNISTDVGNCNGCGIKCPGVANGVANCANSVCGIGSCNKPYLDCNKNPGDGCEINSSSDINNCGACANKCVAIANATPGCANGACDIASCNNGFGDCDKNPANGCEINLNIDSSNCGACGTKCAGGQACSGGKCVAIGACKNPGGGNLKHDNGASESVFYCYNNGDSTQTRAQKACESHFGVGNCCIIQGGYNSQQYGQCGQGGGKRHLPLALRQPPQWQLPPELCCRRRGFTGLVRHGPRQLPQRPELPGVWQCRRRQPDFR